MNQEKEPILKPEIEQKVFEFDHLSVEDEKVADIISGIGACWMIGLAVARQIHHPDIDPYDNLEKIKNDTIKYHQILPADGKESNDFPRDLLPKMRAEGIDVNSIYEIGSYELTGEGKGLDNLLRFYDPGLFIDVLNFVSKENEWGIDFEYIPMVTESNDPKEIFNLFDKEIDRGRVPYVIIDFISPEDEVTYHVVTVTGRTEDGYIISDPLLESKYEMTREDITDLLPENLSYELESGDLVVLDCQEGIISIGKKND